MSQPSLPLTDLGSVLLGIGASAAAEARAWVAKCDRLAELIRRTPPSLEKGLPAEVACLLAIGERAAGLLLDVAWELGRRPRVRQAVIQDRLNPRQAEVVLNELIGVEPSVTDAILDELLDDGSPVIERPEQLRTWVNKRAMAADPDGAKKQRVLAERAETGVRYRSLRGGLAQKITTGPAVAIQQAMRRLDALTPPAAEDDDRTRGQLLLDTELGAIAGAAEASGVLPVPIELELELPVRSGAYALTPVSRLPEPVVIRLDLPALAAAVAGTPLAGMFGPVTPPIRSLTELPVGPRPRKGGDASARLAQLIARRGQLRPDTDGTDSNDDGWPEDDAPQSPSGGPGAARHPFVPYALGDPFGGPGVNTPVQPHRPESVPVLAGHGPVDLELVRQHLHHALIRRVLIDPVTGVCAVDPTLIGLTDLATAPLPAPPPPTDAYAPTKAQQRVVRARYQSCSFPGCRRRACTSDLDHAIAFDQGGETTVANLHPLCRHHHQVKQRGWTVKRDPDGSSLWTSPLGKSYRSTPGEQ